MPKKNKGKKESSDEIVISLDQFVIPGAIVLAGIIIAVAVFLTNKNNTDEVETEDTESVAGEETEYTFDDAVTDIGDSPYLGDKETATVAIVEFNEYQCGYCLRHLEETLPSILTDYVDTGKAIYVFREFAIYGDTAANAAKCVYHLAGVDAYKEFHTKVFSYESDDDIYEAAKEAGIDEDDFDLCYSTREYQDEVDVDFSAGENVGIQGTPGFVVGILDEDGNVTGKLIPGAYPYENFQEVIESFL